jgi:hypothetical protein
MAEEPSDEVFRLQTSLSSFALYGHALEMAMFAVFMLAVAAGSLFALTQPQNRDPARMALIWVLVAAVALAVAGGYAYAAVRSVGRARHERVTLAPEGVTYWDWRNRPRFLAWGDLAGVSWRGSWGLRLDIMTWAPGGLVRVARVSGRNVKRLHLLRDTLIDRCNLQEQPRRSWWSGTRVWVR